MPYKVNKGKRVVWRASKMVDGKRFPKDCATRAEAIAWEKAIEKQMRNPEPTEADMDLVSFAEKYLDEAKQRFQPSTYSEKLKLCRDILEAWGNIPVSEITPAMISEHLLARAKEVSNNSYNRDRKNLKAMFTWAQDILEFDYNPTCKIKPLPHQPKRRYVPPREDVLRVIAAASPADKIMLICYLNTGARRSEIFNLKWADVDFVRGTVTLTTSKTKDGSPRPDTLAMSDQLQQTLLIWKNSPHRRFKRSANVFVCQHPGKSFGRPFTKRRTFMDSLCKRAGVKRFVLHALRHHVASYLADHHGVSTLEIKELLRHQAVSTTERYIQLMTDGISLTLCYEITRSVGMWDLCGVCIGKGESGRASHHI